LRFRFNEPLGTLPGRFIYIRDDETGDYWSNSWQPTGKPLDSFESVCRHGTGYTVIESAYSGIRSEVSYFVPLGRQHEVWQAKIKNESGKTRRLSVFTYAELTNLGNYEQDTVNLQYTQFICRTERKGNAILQHINENICNSWDGSRGIHRFAALAGASASGHVGDREEFLGPYRSYNNPVTVETGIASGSDCLNGNGVGAFKIDLELAPGEVKEFSVLIGEGNYPIAESLANEYSDPKTAASRLEEVKVYWHEKLDRFKVKTPDQSFNDIVNTWNAYQCFITFIWSRAASFIYCGLRNGYGYRDTVQDIQGIMHLDHELASERLRFMLSAQVSNGAGLPLVKYTHNPGHEDTPDDESYRLSTGHPHYRSDDALWLFPTVDKYVKESGNTSFYDELIPFADKDSGTVFEHLKRALQFSQANMTPLNLPAGLEADWNDCLRTGELGVSSFVAFQLRLALEIFREAALLKDDKDSASWAESFRKSLDLSINEHLFESDRFIRAITEDGLRIGSESSDEAKVWLNPQSWAVLSGYAKGDLAKAVLDTVDSRLNTKHGAKIFDPAFKAFGPPVARMALFNPGTKENAGIFSQTQGWIVQAEALAGNGNRAYDYYQKANPASMNESAEIRKIEPYAHGQFVEANEKNHGRAHVHWLTGTASTVMVAAVEGVLGIHPKCDGLEINPCIPSRWDGFTIDRVFRGKNLSIKVINESGSQKGVKRATLNGEDLESCFIPWAKLTDGQNEAAFWM
jgi:cellobiose phosphorylase